jgi:acyl carrier protein
MPSEAKLVEIIDAVRRSLIEERGVEPGILADDNAKLFTTGALDSLDFVWVEAFVMETYEVDLRTSDIMIEDFDTLRRIATRIIAMTVQSGTAPVS